MPMGWRPLRVADGYRVVVASPEGDRTSSVQSGKVALVPGQGEHTFIDMYTEVAQKNGERLQKCILKCSSSNKSQGTG